MLQQPIKAAGPSKHFLTLSTYNFTTISMTVFLDERLVQTDCVNHSKIENSLTGHIFCIR